MSQVSVKQQRPMSPHLQVYKPQITSVMSILHRITGFALVAGSVPLVLWLWGLAYDTSLLEFVRNFFGQWYGITLMIGWTFAFYYHLANGLRHMYWDMGKGFTMKSVNVTGAIALAFVLVATAATWMVILQKGAE